MADSIHAYPTLGLMRGIAALEVVMYHSSGYGGLAPVSSAYLAVDLFFLLSGFVISHAYGEKLAAGMSVRQFMTVRFIRLWPLHILGIVIAATVILASMATSPGYTSNWPRFGLSLASSPFFLPTFSLDPKAWLFPLNVPAWTLFVELAANLLAALVWRRLSNRVLAGVVAVSALALVAVALKNQQLDQGSHWGTLPGGIIRMMFSFFLGVVLYRLRDRFLSISLHPAILVLLVAAILAPNLSGVPRGLYDLLIVLVGCPLLVAAGSASKPWKGGGWFFLLVGQMSYGIYILHAPAADLAASMFGLIGHRDWWAGAPARIAFLAPFLIGVWLAVKLYDEPVRRFLTSIHRTSQKATPA